MPSTSTTYCSLLQPQPSLSLPDIAPSCAATLPLLGLLQQPLHLAALPAWVHEALRVQWRLAGQRQAHLQQGPTAAAGDTSRNSANAKVNPHCPAELVIVVCSAASTALAHLLL